MILWGTDFQPEGLWITAVSVSRADFDLLLQRSVHLVHAQNHTIFWTDSLPSHYIFLHNFLACQLYQRVVNVTAKYFAICCPGLVEKAAQKR